MLDLLPQAHTCSNTLELPNYHDALKESGRVAGDENSEAFAAALRELLSKKLLTAIRETSGYELDANVVPPGQSLSPSGQAMPLVASSAAAPELSTVKATLPWESKPLGAARDAAPELSTVKATLPWEAKPLGAARDAAPEHITAKASSAFVLGDVPTPAREGPPISQAAPSKGSPEVDVLRQSTVESDAPIAITVTPALRINTKEPPFAVVSLGLPGPPPLSSRVSSREPTLADWNNESHLPPGKDMVSSDVDTFLAELELGLGATSMNVTKDSDWTLS